MAEIELKEGEEAPSFEANDTQGNRVALSDFKGKFVVLYFYPKDDTPGCTIEACAFRDDHDQYAAKKVAILGVSKDNEISHQKFTDKYRLPFPLLVDADAKISKAYGAYGEKNFLGIKSVGVKRKTFIIDPLGRLVKIYPKVNPLGHSKDVLRTLEALGA